MNYYETLNVTPDATLQDIKKSYRTLALRHHPDRGGDAEIFKEVSHAYEILSDPELRAQYDRDQTVPETEFQEPLNVFQTYLNQWLDQNPTFTTDPFLKSLLTRRHLGQLKPLIHVAHNYLKSWGQIWWDEWTQTNKSTKAVVTTSTQDTVPVLDHIIVKKNVFLTLIDLSQGPIYKYHNLIIPEDLGLSDLYTINNPEIDVDLPLAHNSFEVRMNLQIIPKSLDPPIIPSYIQKVQLLLDITLSN